MRCNPKQHDDMKCKSMSITWFEVAVHGGGEGVISQTGPGKGVEVLGMEPSIHFNQPALLIAIVAMFQILDTTHSYSTDTQCGGLIL